MPISYVASTTAQVTGTLVTLNVPGGVQAGDVLLAAVLADPTTFPPAGTTVTPPAGWTQFGLLLGGGYGTADLALFWRVIAGGDPSTWQFTCDNTAYITAGLSAYRGCMPSAPVQYATYKNGGGSPLSTTGLSASNAIPPVEPYTLVVYYWTSGVKGPNTFTYTPPAQPSTRYNLGATQDTYGALLCCDESVDEHGEVVARTATGGGDLAYTVALLEEVAHVPSIVHAPTGLNVILYQHKDGPVQMRRYAADGSVESTEEVSSISLTVESPTAVLHDWFYGNRGGAVSRVPIWPDGTLEVLYTSAHMRFGADTLRCLSRNAGASWSTAAEIDLPSLSPKWAAAAHNPSFGRYIVSGVRGDDLVWGFDVDNALVLSAALAYSFAPIGAGGNPTDKPSCIQCLRDGSWMIAIQVDGAVGQWRVYRCAALKSDGSGDWSLWGTVSPGWDIALAEFWLDAPSGLLVAMLLRWSDMTWYVSVGTLNAAGTSWTFGSPVKVTVGSSDLLGQWAQPGLRRREDGVWEFAYTPPADTGDPSAPAIIRCRALAADGTGAWA